MRPDLILKTLEDAGFAACFVGGCVRDTLLGRPVHDWDVTTSALPEEIMALFPRCIPTGIKHGTVTVLLDEESFEVTTFRRDGAYHDGRHPDGVVFVPNLTDEGAFADVYHVMANWGANHGVTVYGHVGADLITLASMLRIPVTMHNVEKEKVFRPHSWASFGTQDVQAADYAACKNYGPLY